MRRDPRLQITCRRLHAGAPRGSGAGQDTGGGGGGRLMRHIATTIATKPTRLRMVSHIMMTSRQSSPFAPDQLTSAVTGGRKIAPIPASPPSTTAPHNDAVTPACW
jgi:hypothetical protein